MLPSGIAVSLRRFLRISNLVPLVIYSERMTEPKELNRVAQMETMIKASGLVKRYGDFTAVKGVNFEVYKGEVFGLLGPNGAGKTTTMEMIEGSAVLTTDTL